MLRLAVAPLSGLALAPAEAKDTGLIYVSNEKSPVGRVPWGIAVDE